MMPRKAPNTTAEDPIKEFTMYFIYSSASDQDDSDMLQAFKTCENSNLKPEWIREKDVRHLPMKPTTVFVLKEFKGSSFEFLSSKDCLVCGPRCVYECVSKKLPVPENQSPVFNTAMLGVVLTTTQVEKQKKDEIRKLVGYMGGSYTPNLCMAVTHLVADRGMSPKCEKAAEISIPIMTSSWVTAVWEESLLSPGVSALDSKFDSHRTPVFHGLEITCSNMSREVKMEMKTLIESNGGTCSGKLVQFTTSLLVISEPEGDKYKHAQMWDIPCVGPSWVYASLKKKVALPPNDHLVKAKPKCSTPTKVSELPSFMNSTDISMVPVGDMSKCEVNDTMSSTSSVMSVKRRKKPPENSGPDYKKYFDQINMAEVGSAGLFLDGCKIYLSGFTNQEKEKLKRVLNAGGATIFMQISDRLSHVVAGNFVAADTKIISKMQPRPNVVTLEWILESMRQGCPAGVQQYLCLQPENTTAPPPSPLSHKGLELLKSDRETPDLPPPVSRKLFVKAKKTVLNASSNFDNENLTMRAAEPEPEVIKIPNTSIPEVRPDCEVQQDKEVEPVPNGGDESRDITQASEVDPCFFQGLVFEMVGIPEPEQAIEAIKTARGSVISGHHGVPDYAVVPLEGTTARVNAAEVVTVLWIEDCFDQNKVVDVMYYHQPLSFKSGCQPLTGTAVCISGYVGRERTFIVYVASILGASVQESLSRKDHPNKGILKATHLVCNEPAGSKYTAAVKWGVPVISHSWLLRCAATGRLEPIELFQLSTGTNNKNTPVPDKSSASSECSMNKLSSNVVAQTPNVKVRSSMGPPAGQLAVDQLESKTPGGPQTPMNISVAPKCGVVATPAAELTLKGWGVGDASAAPDMFSPANRSERDGNDTSDEKFASANSTSASGNRSLNGGKSLIITKRKVTPSNSQLINSQRINDYDDDELEFELGIRSKRHASGGSVSGKDESAFMTPPVQRRISVASPGPSPFHIDTPDSPYGQVFADNPSPETRKKWKRYIDGFPDLYEGSPALKDRRLSTPLSVIKKQLLVKFGGAEVEGIDPETGDLLPNGPYGQWANGACDVSGAASLPPEAPIAEGRGDVGVEKKPISLEKINPRVLALKSNENTPLSSTKNAKKFVRKGTFESPKPEETPEQKQATAQYKRTPELDLMEKYRNFDANNEITDEMRKRLANRLKPTSQDSDDADNPLKETLKRDMEGSVTWDIERPKYLEKMMEKELAKKAAKLVNGKSWAEDATETTLEGPAEPKGPPMKFTLSSMQQTNREKYENIIKNLGGEVSSTSHYDSSITHIVIDKPIRSEKLLCSIASGKWVLHVSYLDQCYESRQFLPEEDYEWGNPRSSARLPAVGVGSQEALLARAAYWWRHRVTEIGARLALPFAAMKAVLLTVPNKTPQYSRLLLAGGATILEQEKILEATHCFVDVGKVKIPVDIKQLARREIHCLPPVYLGDYLSKIPAPSPQNYWIEEYRNAFEALKNSK